MLTTRIISCTKILLLIIVIVLGCRKPDLVPLSPLLTPPVARAGIDTTIFLPDQRGLYLDGSASNDPDGYGWPLIYTWTKISGPEVQNFNVALAGASMVISEPGIYQFELIVKDRQALTSRDTVTITAKLGAGCSPEPEFVNSSYYLEGELVDLIPIDFSFGRGAGKLVFAGGRTEQDDGWGGYDVYSSAFWVYDIASKTTQKNTLSVGRGGIGVAISSNEVFLAGGRLLSGISDVVDIYDLSAKTLSKAKLSAARHSISCEMAGNKLFFAGGRNYYNETSDVVDIYDLSAKTWSTAKLSQPRAGISIVSSGTKVFFAGGDISFGTASGRVDIYDLNTGQWSMMELQSPKWGISSSFVDNSVVFAGGYSSGYNNKVNLAVFVNASGQTIKSDCLIARNLDEMVFGPNMITAVVNEKDLYYLSNNVISRYQSGTQKWGISIIPPNLDLIGLASSGNNLLGISLTSDNNSNGYIGKVLIRNISF